MEVSKESIIDLGEYLHTKVRVFLVGGKEVSGILKSFDKIPNLVLDEAEEEGGRHLGVVILRGPLISAVMPDSLSPVENPFVT